MTARLMVLRNGMWVPNWADGGPAPYSRDDLVRGAYIPDAFTTGPTITSFTDQEGNSAGTFSMNAAGQQCYGTTHWSDIRHTAERISHEECRFAGPDPVKMYSGVYGAAGAGQLVKSYGYKHWKAKNCIFDPNLWQVERGRAPMTDANFVSLDGVSGGDCELLFCHIRNVVDGIHFMHQDNPSDAWTASGYSEPNFSSPAGQRFAVIDRCLIEKGVYVAGNTYGARPGAQSDKRPHCDGLQIMQGKNLYVVGSMIGGVRDSAGYVLWPNTGDPGNTGFDYSNAPFMIKQEGTFSAGAVQWIDNVKIEDNVIGGGVIAVNFYTGSGNTLTGVSLRRNRFLRRKNGDGLGTNSSGTVTSAGGGYGYYRNSVLGATWADNTVLETGVAIPTGTSMAQ